jgi:hypothetical protein
MLVGLVELGPRLLSSRLPALGSIAWRPRARRAREELAGELTDILVCLAARPQTKVSISIEAGDEQCGYDALTRVLGQQPPMAPALPFGGIGNEPPPR